MKDDREKLIDFKKWFNKGLTGINWITTEDIDNYLDSINKQKPKKKEHCPKCGHSLFNAADISMECSSMVCDYSKPIE